MADTPAAHFVAPVARASSIAVDRSWTKTASAGLGERVDVLGVHLGAGTSATMPPPSSDSAALASSEIREGASELVAAESADVGAIDASVALGVARSELVEQDAAQSGTMSGRQRSAGRERAAIKGTGFMAIGLRGLASFTMPRPSLEVTPTGCTLPGALPGSAMQRDGWQRQSDSLATAWELDTTPGATYVVEQPSDPWTGHQGAGIAGTRNETPRSLGTRKLGL